MIYYVGSIPASDSLMHYGIKGMKWGRRRYENYDGTLTEAGRRRYGSQKVYDSRKRLKEARRNILRTVASQGPAGTIRGLDKNSKEYRDQLKAHDQYWNARKRYKSSKREQRKKRKLGPSKTLKVEKRYAELTGRKYTIGSVGKKGREKDRQALAQIRKEFGPEAYDYMRSRVIAGRIATAAPLMGAAQMIWG